MLMRWARSVSAYSLTCESGRAVELTESIKTGWSAGLTLRKLGGWVMPVGNRLAAAEMAACTSWAAESMSRFRLNCSVMRVWPKELEELIESRPAIVVNWRSRGEATEEAIVSGLAPERLAVTWMVGKSTLGRLLTGSWV
ncbi:hypothetical protein D3C72_907100 [compost metagenome]